MNLPLDTIAVGELTFSVVGNPQQQGSKVPGQTKTGVLFVRDDNPARLRNWRALISPRTGRADRSATCSISFG